MSKHLLTSRGLIIALKSHSRDYVSPGKQLFYHFQTANEVLYWNSNLYEAVHNCQLLGFILPSTLLLSGPDIFLETIKLAWSKRLLKAPKGYSMEMVGEFSGIEIRRIQQVHFIPLDEALCYIIYDLNCNNRESSFDTVVSKLAEWYRGMQLPPSELILNTLRQLMEKRQVYHTGYGYSILTTDKAAVADWLVRLPSTPSQLPMDPVSPLKRSGSTSDISSLGGAGPYHSRRWSVREPLRRHHLRRFSPPPLPVQERLPWSADSGLPTSQSHLNAPPASHLHYLLAAADARGQPPSPPAPPPGPEPAPDNNNGEREPRGKSPSIFRKLLSLGKAKRREKGAKAAATTAASPGPAPVPAPARPDLAAFSGQFPPPEWLWYLNHQHRSPPAPGDDATPSHRVPRHPWPGAGRRRAASDEDLPSLPSPMQPLHSFGPAPPAKANGVARRAHGERRRSHHHHHHHHHHHRQSGRHRAHRSARHLSASGDLLDEGGAAGAGPPPAPLTATPVGAGQSGGGRKAKLRQSKSMHERLHHHQPSSTSGPSSVGTTPVQECSPAGFAPGPGPGATPTPAAPAAGAYDDSGFHSSRNTTEGDASESKCSMLKARFQQQQQLTQPVHARPEPAHALGAPLPLAPGEGHYGSLDRAVLRRHGWPPPIAAQPGLAGARSPAVSSEETGNSSSASASASAGGEPGARTSGPPAVPIAAANVNGLETVLEASTQELAPRGAPNRSENSIFVETDLDAAILAV